jgi:hypothetical protein
MWLEVAILAICTFCLFIADFINYTILSTVYLLSHSVDKHRNNRTFGSMLDIGIQHNAQNVEVDQR